MTDRSKWQAEIDRADAAIAAAGFERIPGTGRWRHPRYDDVTYTWDEALAEARMNGITADSPATLGPEGERLAREERWT